jgi:hypothetical protein
MFLLDSLLLAPGKAVLFMLEELAKKAQEEFLDDDSVKQELQEIYARLEGGSISEHEFETRELGLMQRLEQIARAKFEDSWGTPNMGLQRAFFQGPSQEDQDVLVADVVREAEALPAIAPIPVHDGGRPDVPALLLGLLGQTPLPPAIDVGSNVAARLLGQTAPAPVIEAAAHAPALLLPDHPAFACWRRGG